MADTTIFALQLEDIKDFYEKLEVKSTQSQINTEVRSHK